VREREAVLRFAPDRVEGLRAVFAAPVERLAAGFFAADERFEAAPADFARVDVLRAPELLRVADLLFELFRVPLERDLADRAVARDPPDEDEPLLISPSIDHLPDITRCAASATASAMIDPSLVALDTTFVAACDAVSAASSPASRILRRAAGLALIAAAAAARPAASISLLIAAFASLSRLSLLDRDEEPEELFFEDLAIASTPSVWRKDT
jgi:hypothetical protein